MDPREYFYAMLAKRDFIVGKRHEAYEVARLQAVLVINSTLKREQQYRRVQDLIRFVWEKEVKQTVGQMKQAVLAIARAQGVSKTPLKRKTIRTKKKK